MQTQFNPATATESVTVADVQASLQGLTDAARILAPSADDPHCNRAAALARDWGMTPAEARAWVQGQIDLDRAALARLTGEPVHDSLAARVNVGVAPDRGHTFAKAKYRGL